MLEGSKGSTWLGVRNGLFTHRSGTLAGRLQHLEAGQASLLPHGISMWLVSFLIVWWNQASWTSYAVSGFIQGKLSNRPRLQLWKSHDLALAATCHHFGALTMGDVAHGPGAGRL